MKKSVISKAYLFLFIFSMVLTTVSCEKDEITEDAIQGTWRIETINNVDVTSLICIQDSYIRADDDIMTFYIQEDEDDGSCVNVIDQSFSFTVENGKYISSGEDLLLSVSGSTLTWSVSSDAIFIFKK